MQDSNSSDSAGPDQAGAGRRVRLPAVLGIEQAAALKALLGETLEQPEPVVLDGAAVDAVHGAALQLFCLYCRDRSALGHEVEFARPSPALRAAAALLGASTLLQIAGAAA